MRNPTALVASFHSAPSAREEWNERSEGNDKGRRDDGNGHDRRLAAPHLATLVTPLRDRPRPAGSARSAGYVVRKGV